MTTQYDIRVQHTETGSPVPVGQPADAGQSFVGDAGVLPIILAMTAFLAVLLNRGEN
jgi:hypothetical protein